MLTEKTFIKHKDKIKPNLKTLETLLYIEINKNILKIERCYPGLLNAPTCC